MALPPGPPDLAPLGRVRFIFTAARHPGSARQRHFVGSWGPAHGLGGPGFVCWTPDSCWAPFFLYPQSCRCQGSGLGLVGSALLAGNHRAQAGGIWFGALPARHPHPMPGQSRAAAAASLHFEAWDGGGGGGGEVLGVLCHLGLVLHASSPAESGLLFPVPLCSLELGEDACLALIFLFPSSLPLLFPCNGSPFWHLLPLLLPLP